MVVDGKARLTRRVQGEAAHVLRTDARRLPKLDAARTLQNVNVADLYPGDIYGGFAVLGKHVCEDSLVAVHSCVFACLSVNDIRSLLPHAALDQLRRNSALRREWRSRLVERSCRRQPPMLYPTPSPLRVLSTSDEQAADRIDHSASTSARWVAYGGKVGRLQPYVARQPSRGREQYDAEMRAGIAREACSLARTDMQIGGVDYAQRAAPKPAPPDLLQTVLLRRQRPS